MVRRPVVAWVGASVLLVSLTGCTEKPRKEDRFAAYFCEEQEPEHSERGECDGGECVVEGHRWGKEIAYIELDEGDLESANLIMEGTWPVPRYEPVKLPDPLTWREDPYGEKYWQFVFYGLRPTAHLLWAYRETGLRKYRDKLMQVLESYSQHGPSSPFGWDKHGTAFRAMVLVNTYWKLKHANALSLQEARLLEDMIRSDAVFLAHPKNFQGSYNHGFAQAAGLLMVAENFPGWPESHGWRELVFSRYADLLDLVIAPDGFIVENSVYYHFYVMAQVWMLVGWAKQYDVKLPGNLWAAVDRMVYVGARIIQPDGNIPMLGASQARQVRRFLPPLFYGLAEKYPELRHTLSAGMCGTAPTDRLSTYWSAGLAILRSDFGGEEEYVEQTHVTFDAGPFRTDHSHLDAMNLVLFAAGRTLLTDSGMFTEDSGPEKDYYQGTRAHNTVVVDGKDQSLGDAVLGTSITGDGWLYQSGHHTLYEGVMHWRSIFLLEKDVVLVLDRLKADTPRQYEQRWHLPPDLMPTLEGTAARVENEEGQRLLRIVQANPRGLSVSSVRGGKEPVDGWYSTHYGKQREATVLLYQREGGETDYATLFAAGEYATQHARVSSSGNGSVYEVQACAAGHAWSIRVDGVGQGQERVSVERSDASCQ